MPVKVTFYFLYLLEATEPYSEKFDDMSDVVRDTTKNLEKDGKEELKPSQLKFDSMDKIYPVGKLALFWKVAEEFEIGKSISKVIGKESERFFFFQDITRIQWNGDQSHWAENGYGSQTGRPQI